MESPLINQQRNRLIDMAKDSDRNVCPDNVNPDREWKFLHSDWSCKYYGSTLCPGIPAYKEIVIVQLTETLNIWAAYALMFCDVFVSTDGIHICWAT